jgi:hypothetical protein
MRPIKLFSDITFCGRHPHVEMLWPYFGKPVHEPHDLLYGRFDRYIQDSNHLFELSNRVDDADIAVLPFDYGLILNRLIDPAVAQHFVTRAWESSVRSVVFCWHDDDAAIPLDNIFLFRTSMKKAQRTHFNEVFPWICEDFSHYYCGGHLSIRPKQTVPVICFCGRADPLDGQRSAFPLLVQAGQSDWQYPQYPYEALRSYCMRLLLDSEKINCNFITRDKTEFWGRPNEGSPVEVVDAVARRRRQFVDNMVSSDYVLCVRGAGNFSMRFYETLSCGRIPILVDTDSPLPFENEVRWDDYIIRVPLNDITRLPAALEDFHRSISAIEFENRQRQIRKLWEDYVEPLGFFSAMHRWMRRRLRP